MDFGCGLADPTQSIKGLITVVPGDHTRTPVQKKGMYVRKYARTHTAIPTQCMRACDTVVKKVPSVETGGGGGGERLLHRDRSRRAAGGRPNPLRGLLGTALTFRNLTRDKLVSPLR